MNVVNAGTRFLFMVGLLLLLVTSNTRLALSSLQLYEFNFHKYNISLRTGISQRELMEVAEGLIAYFNSKDSAFDVRVNRNNREESIFSQKEIIHLKDVKEFFQFTYRIQEASALYIAAFLAQGFIRKRKAFLRELACSTLIGSATVVSLLALLAAATLIGFDQLFLQLHLSVFSNYFWLLDPSRDYLIMMFPQGFFQDAILFGAIATLGEALLIAVGAIFLLDAGRSKIGTGNAQAK